MEEIIEHLAALRAVPVAVIRDPAKAVPLAEALIAGGCDTLIVSFQEETAADSIQAIATAFPEMSVGAGAVTSVEEISTAHIAGAAFATASGFDPIVVDTAHAAGLPIIPGMMTPSNVSQALVHGCSVLNFFPATLLGTEMLKAILAAYRHKGIRIIASGGINIDNVAEWLTIPEVLACCASWICPEDLIEAEDWAEITRRVQETLATTQI